MRVRVALLLVFLALGGPACSDTSNRDPADSVIRITTPAARGTGVVLIPGFAITDAHVVWPAEEVEIQLADGREFQAAVVGFERHLDLALLALPDAAATALNPIAIASTVAEGARVTHLGFAERSGSAPGALMQADGRVTGQLRLPQVGAAFIGTDASGSTGLSGGPLVNARGELLGITQFQVAPSSVYALSAPDALAAANRLIEEWDSDSPVALRLVAPDRTELLIDLNEPQAHRAWVVQGPREGLDLRLVGTTDAPLELTVIDVHGHVAAEVARVEAGAFDLQASIPGHEVRIVVIRTASPRAAHVRLVANTQLRMLADEDHVSAIQTGSEVKGVLDYPSDVDLYEVELPARGTSLITVSSVTFDPVLRIELVDEGTSISLASDDNGGGGLFGRDALIQFTAPRSALYRVVVADAGGGLGHAGGYTLLVSTPFVDQ